MSSTGTYTTGTYLEGKINYEILGTTIPNVTIKAADVGTVIAVEAGRNISFLSCTNGNPDWHTETGNVPGKGTRATMHVATNQKRRYNENFTLLGWVQGKMEKSFYNMEATEEAHVLGEIPIFTYCTSLMGNATIKISNHYPAGVILPFEAEKGVMLIRQGGFLAGLETVNLDRFTIPSSRDETEYFRSKQLGIRYMQRVSGGGLYFLEAQGDVETVDIGDGKAIAVDPMRLVAMTENVSIVRFISTGKTKVIRDNVGHDFDVVLQATGKAGKVYVSSRIQKNHFNLEKPEKDDEDEENEDKSG